MTVFPFGSSASSPSSSTNYSFSGNSSGQEQNSWNSTSNNSFSSNNGGMHLVDKRESEFLFLIATSMNQTMYCFIVDSTSWISYSSKHTGQPGFMCTEHRQNNGLH